MTLTEGNFEASGKHEQEPKDHAHITHEHESHAEDEEGSALDAGSGAKDSGREDEM